MRSASLLRAIADQIEEDPDSYDQMNWLELDHDGWTEHTEDLVGATRADLDDHLDGACGTKCCIAGWAWVLGTKNQPQAPVPCTTDHWIAKGATLLGLTSATARNLFDPYYQPPVEMSVPDVLRQLADLPEPRSMDDHRVRDALFDPIKEI